jgi:hypothetical protein
MFLVTPDLPHFCVPSTLAFTFPSPLDYSRVTQWKSRMPQENHFTVVS